MQSSRNTTNLYTKQLNMNEILSDGQYDDISNLIYETDRYIYPALFYGESDPRNNALHILPHILKLGTDSMFNKERLFVGLEEYKIVGLILWIKGTLYWDADNFMLIASKLGIDLLKSNVYAVKDSYIEERYTIGNNSHISIINVAVHPEYRGQGVGHHLLKEFIEEHKEETMELCVLADNAPAISLYQNCGFKIASQTSGFSLGDDKPMCLDMIRHNNSVVDK